MKKYDALIIGGGSAGLAAAAALKENGIDNIAVLEKDDEAGGILQQCIHNGFGLMTFGEQLSGPAYAERFIRKAAELGVEIKTNTMVTKLTADRKVEYVNSTEGAVTAEAGAVVLAVGCYERPRGAINITGDRCAGVYTAGQAQKYLNIDGYMVGKKVFILGSGDIGLIMARRMKLEGADVLGVAEIMPYSNGLPRNIKQCLEDFDIPLMLSHTVSKTFADKNGRLEKIEVVQVDENLNPIAGSEQYFDADTLLLSVGLIPENHLADEIGIVSDRATKGPVVDESYMTSAEGIFACGNGLHVHDLVDFVTIQAARAGKGAAEYLKNGAKSGRSITVGAGSGIGYTVPSLVHPESVSEDVEFFFRVTKPLTDAVITLTSGGEVLRTIKKKKIVPSEMQRITVKKDVLAGLTDGLEISAEGVVTV